MKNCRADNLKWASKSENAAHKSVHGTNSPERFGKLTKDQVAYIRSQLGTKSHAAIARELGVVKADAVSKIARGERWNGAAIASGTVFRPVFTHRVHYGAPKARGHRAFINPDRRDRIAIAKGVQQ